MVQGDDNEKINKHTPQTDLDIGIHQYSIRCLTTPYQQETTDLRLTRSKVPDPPVAIVSADSLIIMLGKNFIDRCCI